MRRTLDYAQNTHVLHEPRNCAARDIEALAAKLPPNFPNPMDPPVLFRAPEDLGAQRLVPAGTIRPPGQMFIIGGRGNRQHAADRPCPAGSDRWRLDGQAPCAARCASMKPTITSTGGRVSQAALEAMPLLLTIIAKYGFASGLAPV